MEIVLPIVIVVLAALGLSVGLIMGRGAPRSACDGLACIGGTRCDGCPHSARKDGG